jgi:hypothetical protein
MLPFVGTVFFPAACFFFLFFLNAAEEASKVVGKRDFLKK